MLVSIMWSGTLVFKEAPWYGRFWQKLAGQLKRYSKKAIGRAYLNFYELQTVTNETELALNSRPLGVLHVYYLEEPLNSNSLL